MTIAERFWSKVNIKKPDECWEWKEGKYSGGYGHFHINGKGICAHRFAYLLSGNIFKDKKTEVIHRCDNPACCNPSHLFGGSHVDNMADMKNKKRNIKHLGENNGRSKLKANDIVEIIKLHGRMKIKDIANIYKVSIQQISKIHRKKRWAHINQL